MPVPSNAFFRYQIIDKCLTNQYKPFPTMETFCMCIKHGLKIHVSPETIQKDIAFMKLPIEEGGYNAPIRYKRSKNGYYYDYSKYPEYDFNQFGFNKQNLAVIELAIGALERYTGIMPGNAYHNALSSLYTSLRIEKTSKDESLSNVILPQKTTRMSGVEYFELYTNCIMQKIPLSFIHYSYKNKRFSTQLIHPYLLKESLNRWYLVGFSEKHAMVRVFGIDRMYSPMAVEKEFVHSDLETISNSFSNKIGLATLKNEKTEKIILLVNPVLANYIKSQPLHNSQKINELSKGSLEVELNLIPTTEFVSLVLSYGARVILKKPLWLQRHIAKEASKIHSLYSSNN